MHFSPILIFHILAGTIGCISGAVAVSFRKGSPRHTQSGSVFTVSMLTLAVTGTYLAFITATPGNIFGGTLTFYLVATSWIAARRKEGEITHFDRASLLVSSSIVAVTLIYAIQAAQSPDGKKYGYEPGVYIFLGSIALACAIGDARLLRRGGISGTARIARHLWRMCFAWFIASASIFLARQHLFPRFMRTSGLLCLLTLAPLILMFFWLARLKFKNVAAALTSAERSQAVGSLGTPTCPE